MEGFGVCFSSKKKKKKCEVTYTNNVFSSFLLGISRGPFPFTISIRRQNEDFLVLDDLLSLTRVHLNCLPGTRYIPDFLTLLRHPAQSLALIEAMFEECWSVVESQFWPQRDTLFAQGSVPTLADLRRHVISGFNWPPSQYQLHLQFMLPPLLPFQMLACSKKVHFTFGRFFPFEFVQAMLRCPEQFDWKEGSSIDDLFAFYKGKFGLDYAAVHAECYQRYMLSNAALGNWSAAEFEGVIVGTEFFRFREGEVLEDQV